LKKNKCNDCDDAILDLKGRVIIPEEYNNISSNVYQLELKTNNEQINITLTPEILLKLIEIYKTVKI
jgi:hypothetical protein